MDRETKLAWAGIVRDYDVASMRKRRAQRPMSSMPDETKERLDAEELTVICQLEALEGDELLLEYCPEPKWFTGWMPEDNLDWKKVQEHLGYLTAEQMVAVVPAGIQEIRTFSVLGKEFTAITLSNGSICLLPDPARVKENSNVLFVSMMDQGPVSLDESAKSSHLAEVKLHNKHYHAVQEITIEFNSFAFDERFKQSEMAKRVKELLPEDPQELLSLPEEELTPRLEEVVRLCTQLHASEEQVQERRQQLIAFGINKENWLDRQ